MFACWYIGMHRLDYRKAVAHRLYAGFVFRLLPAGIVLITSLLPFI